MDREAITVSTTGKTAVGRKVKPYGDGELRPNFRVRDKKVTVKMNGGLFLDAQQSAVNEMRALTGGTMSGLVEFLLWEHLGRQDKHLANDDETA